MKLATLTIQIHSKGSDADNNLISDTIADIKSLESMGVSAKMAKEFCDQLSRASELKTRATVNFHVNAQNEKASKAVEPPVIKIKLKSDPKPEPKPLPELEPIEEEIDLDGMTRSELLEHAKSLEIKIPFGYQTKAKLLKLIKES